MNPEVGHFSEIATNQMELALVGRSNFLKNRQQNAVVAIRVLGKNVTPAFPICSKSVSFREVRATKAYIPS